MLIVGLVAGVVTGRRWAWVVSLLLELSVLATLMIELDDVVALGLSATRFGLLVSPPVRRHVFDRPTAAHPQPTCR